MYQFNFTLFIILVHVIVNYSCPTTHSYTKNTNLHSIPIHYNTKYTPNHKITSMKTCRIVFTLVREHFFSYFRKHYLKPQAAVGSVSIYTEQYTLVYTFCIHVDDCGCITRFTDNWEKGVLSAMDACCGKYKLTYYRTDHWDTNHFTCSSGLIAENQSRTPYLCTYLYVYSHWHIANVPLGLFKSYNKDEVAYNLCISGLLLLHINYG